jgi:hypothetical protein
MMGLAPSASVLLARSPDRNDANVERNEWRRKTQFAIIFRGIIRAKEIKHIATSQLVQGDVCGFVQ